MKKIIALFVSTAILLAPLTAMSQGILQSVSTTPEKALASAVAPIKSANDLKNYLKMTPLKSSPLRYLSSVDRQIFINSLTFNEKGVTSFYYAGLKGTLSKAQVNQILSLIGSQHLTEPLLNPVLSNGTQQAMMAATDYADYKCESKGNCVKSTGSTCNSSC